MPRAKPVQLTPSEQAKLQAYEDKKRALDREKRELLKQARRRARSDDNRITMLIGVAVRDEAEKNPSSKAELVELLTRFFTRQNERDALAAWGVPPLPAPQVSTQQDVTAPDTPSAELPPLAAQSYGDGVRMVRH